MGIFSLFGIIASALGLGVTSTKEHYDRQVKAVECEIERNKNKVERPLCNQHDIELQRYRMALYLRRLMLEYQDNKYSSIQSFDLFTMYMVIKASQTYNIDIMSVPQQLLCDYAGLAYATNTPSCVWDWQQDRYNITTSPYRVLSNTDKTEKQLKMEICSKLKLEKIRDDEANAYYERHKDDIY